MQWIEYDYVCNEDLGIVFRKKVEYNEANLAIAEQEAYGGVYDIVEDEEDMGAQPIAIELGGTGAKTAAQARTNLGALSSAAGAVKTANLADGSVAAIKIPDGELPRTKLAADAKSKGVSVTLTSGGWSGNTQTVSVNGVTASNNIVVVAAPESRSAYNDAEIYCSAQGEGTLTFACGSAPSEDIIANVLILP